MDEILNPSCSEQVFRLTGDLENVKTEVLEMLNLWQQEQRDEGFDIMKRKINKLRKKINNITNLKEFELIVFEFTCNYETYFKKEGDDLLVATCNNHEWSDGVNFDHENAEKYSEIASENYYKLIFKEDNYVIAKKAYGDKKLGFFEIKREIKCDSDKDFKLIKKKGDFYVVEDNELIKVKEIKDENLKNKLLILANL